MGGTLSGGGVRRREGGEGRDGGERFLLLSQNSQTTINQMLRGTRFIACMNVTVGFGEKRKGEK